MIPLFAAKALPFLRTYWKEIAVGGVVLTLAFVCWVRGERLDAAKEWQGNVIAALTEASGAEKPVAKKNVTAGIRALGKSVDRLTVAVAEQNAAVATLARTAAERQKASQDALRAAEKRNEALAGKIAGLERSASVRRSGAVCEVSDEVRDVWE